MADYGSGMLTVDQVANAGSGISHTSARRLIDPRARSRARLHPKRRCLLVSEVDPSHYIGRSRMQPGDLRPTCDAYRKNRLS